jgi:serine/threonine protein kinase
MRECPICHYCYEDEWVACSQDQATLQYSLPGSRRIGNYQITRLIARGTISNVYCAQQADLARNVAIKILSPDLSTNLEAREGFRREALALANLKHPHIVTVFDLGVSDQGLVYWVMELLTGRTLATRLVTEKRLEIPVAVRIVTAIAQALELAHNQGVIHRNLKPTNIFLARQESSTAETVKLIDFGLTKLQQDARRLTTGALMGSLHYTAPEQCRDGVVVDSRADIYALGAVAYHLLAGQPPFLATNPAQLMEQQLTATPWPLQKFLFDITPELETLILKALEKDPGQRPQSMAEFAAELAAAPQQGVRRTVSLFVSNISKSHSPNQPPRLPQFDQFVGHQREREKIAVAYTQQESSAPNLWLLVGAPGIGRSRLLQTAIAPLAAQGALVFTGKFTSLPASLLVVTNLKQYLEELNSTAPQQFTQLFGTMATNLRGLLEQFSHPTLSLISETRSQEIIVQAISQLAKHQRVVLALDDLHYADPANLKLINYLLGRAARDPIFFIVTASTLHLAQRENFAARWLDNLASKRQLQRISLAPLTLSEVKTFLEKEFLPAVFSTATLAQLYRLSGGHPQYLITLLQALMLQEQITWQTDHWEFAELNMEYLPETLIPLVTENLEFVSFASRRMLAQAAILGEIWGFEALRQSQQWDEDQLIQLIDECLQYGILSEINLADSNDDYYQFTSSAMQQVLYQQWRWEQRQPQHLQVAAVLEKLARQVSTSPERQAAIEHWCRGGNLAAAFSQQVLALRIAWHNEEQTLAQQYWQQARKLFAEFDYQSLLGGNEVIASNTAIAVLATALVEYFVLGVELLDPNALLRATETLDYALRLAQRLHNPLLMAQVFVTMGKQQQHWRNYDLARQYWENALGIYQEIGELQRYQTLVAQIAALPPYGYHPVVTEE